MKVAIVTGNIKYIVTGSERYLNEVALYLKRKKVDTTLLIVNDKRVPKRTNPNYTKIKQKYEKIKSKAITPKIIHIGPLHTDFFYFKGLPKDSILYLPSNIYVHLLNILLKPPKQKYIIGSHVLQFQSYYQSGKHVVFEKTFNKMIKNTLKLKSKEFKKNLFFHVINLQQKIYLEQEFGINPKNIIHVPIFAHAENFKIGRNSSKQLKILHIGGSAKKADLVLKLIHELVERGKIGEYEFHFIGKSEPEELDKIASKYPNVINHGMADDKEKIRLHAESDVLIVPSIEAFPLTALEGLAAGLVIVSRSNSINNELRELGADIINVAEETPSAFADALEKVAIAKGKGELTASRKEKDRKLVLENFSYDAVMPKVLKMFEFVEDA